MGNPMVEPYRRLISAFVGGEMEVGEFERTFLQMFKGDPSNFREDEFVILDALFADVDAFCADLELRGEGDLDADGLRARAESALAKLTALSAEGGTG